MNSTEMTGYPSIDKPWLSNYSEDVINMELPSGSMYSYLKECSLKYNKRFAINYYGKQITYEDLIHNIDAAATAFELEGVKKGDYVSAFLLRVPETIYAFYGLNKIGAIPDMEYVTLDTNCVEKAVKNVNASIVLVMDMFLSKIESALKNNSEVRKIIVIRTLQSTPWIKRNIGKLKLNVRLPKDNRYVFYDIWVKNHSSFHKSLSVDDSDATAVIVHTGGTTGVPKGVELTNTNFNSLAKQYSMSILKGYSGKVLCIAPPFVGFGLGIGLHQLLCCGFELCIEPDPNPEKIPLSNRFYKPEHLLVGPPHYMNLIHDKKTGKMNFSHLVTLGSGGEKITQAFAEEVDYFFEKRNSTAHLFNGYGMTETATGGFTETHTLRKYETAGIPLPLTNVKIVDVETNQELKYRQVGEIVFSTPSLMKGYYCNQEETDKIIQVDENDNRWIKTGDLGYVDEDGFLFIKGRIKRIFFVLGADNSIYKLFPSYIESVIMQNKENVKQCGVIAVSSDGKYYVPIAYVVKNNENLTKANLLQFCTQNLEEFNVPKDIVFVNKIPVTTSGKIDYIELERMYEEMN